MATKIDIIEEVKEILELNGNPYLVKIFEQYKDDERELCLALRRYANGLYVEITEGEEEEEGEEKKIPFRYIYLNGIIIDFMNIARIELDSDYDAKKHKMVHFIKVVKKYPSPMEEEYIIPYDSEEERDRGYEVLKGKLKLCKIYIC